MHACSCAEVVHIKKAFQHAYVCVYVHTRSCRSCHARLNFSTCEGCLSVDGINLAPAEPNHCRPTSRTPLNIDVEARLSVSEVVQDFRELDPLQKRNIMAILKRVREV
jgi:hypothetical protein